MGQASDSRIRNAAALLRSGASTGRDPAWGVLDQAIYSGTNFAAIIIVARVLGPETFGAFVSVLAVWATVWVLGRSVFAEPFVIRASDLSASGWRREAELAYSAIGRAGVLAAAVIVLGAIALPLSDEVTRSLLVLALFVPILLVQDYWRVAAFSQGRGHLAAGNDAAWAIVQFGCFGALAALGLFSAPAAVAAWGLGGLSGAVVGQAQFRLRPATRTSATRWAREAFRLGGWFGAAWGMNTASTQLAYVVVGLFAGLSAVGGLSSVYALFGPLGMLYRAMALPALPAIARSAGRSRLALAASYGGGLGLLAAIYGAGVVAGGSALLAKLYGQPFAEFAPLLVPAAIAFVALAVGSSAAVALRAQQRGRALLGAETVNSVAHLALALALLLGFGVIGVPWGYALASVSHAALLWLLLARSRGHQLRPVAHASQGAR